MARADEPVYDLDVPAMNAAEALNRFAEQTGAIMLFPYDLASAQRANAVRGRYTLLEGLDVLLRGTGLSGGLSNKRVVSISRLGNEQRTGENGSMQKHKESLRTRFAAFVASMFAATAASGEEAGSAPAVLEEIIVTAQKRAERVQDVPIPVTAVNTDALARSNQVRLQDYSTSIPGLSVTPSTQSAQVLSIRGVITGTGGNPAVGVTVDDVPYGASTGLGGGNVTPDIDPSELARIEVLRGPQGTLYGASSMGGLFKFVTLDPSTAGFSGRVQGGVNSVRNGDEPGYNVRGSVNVPFSDTLAMRASAFTRHDPGYIDDPSRGIEGVNSSRAAGGRLSAMWRPTEDFSLKLSALYQDTKGDGTSDTDVGTGLADLQQSRLKGTGWYDRKIQAYSAVAIARFGMAELTSLTGYNINEFSDAFDFSFAYGPFTNMFFGVTGTPGLNHNEVRKFTQELRFSAPLGDRIDWLVGAFYTDEDSAFTQQFLAATPATGAIVGESMFTSFPTSFSEKAVFADVALHVTDRFSVQVGGRQSFIRQTSRQSATGVFTPLFFGMASPVTLVPGRSTSDAFTYLVTPQLKVSPDLMLYARLASGYRAGGVNIGAVGAAHPEYAPDKTQNYELGAKGNLFDRLLSFDASLYYIDWKDIQLTLVDPVTFTGYQGNGAAARSQGIELSIESRPLRGLTLTAWGALNDAQLTEGFPSTSSVRGADGARLPLSSRVSGSLSVDQEFPLAGSLRGFVGASATYVGDREGRFRSAAVRERYPSYTKTNLLAGVRSASWTATFFVNNLTDERGETNGGLGAFPPYAFVYIQPRTAGLQLDYSFE